MALHLHSPAFPANGTIPQHCTGEGANRSPPLVWSGWPIGTSAFVLVCDDPDVPHGAFTHWLLYDLPGESDRLEEGVGNHDEPSVGVHGRNDFGGLGYAGPMPPVGERHRYRFTLSALASRLHLPAGVDRGALEAALAPQVLERARLVGTYRRSLALVP